MKAILFSITALLSGAALHAQADLQNNGTLFVSGPSTILYVNGSFNNASGAAFTNNGNLYVLQNINNAQTAMAAGTGTLFLSGAALQSVAGTQAFKTFNLVTNNAAGISLDNDLSVSGAHTFTAGIISSSVTPNYLVYEAGSSYTGDADTRHVKGWVTKNGNTAFIFPIGNGTVERTIAINALSAASVFNANYAGATTNTANLASPLVTVDPNEYWILNKVSGGTATVGMNWDNSKIAMPPYLLANIRVANYTGGLWTQAGTGATGNVTTTGAITSNTLSAFGPLTFGSLSFALPVHLLQLSASILNQEAVVKWSTSDEINVQYYEVQRSDDGISFYTIGQVAARNLTAVQQYSFTDSKALNNVNFYRLRSVDTDGKAKLSDIVTLNNNTATARTMAVANPARGSMHLTVTNLSGDVDYRINTLGGQTLQQGVLHLAGSGSYEIYLSPGIKNNMYILQVQKTGLSFTRKILVQ